MKKILLTIITLLLLMNLTFSGCSKSAAQTDNPRLDVVPVSDEGSAETPTETSDIDVDWPY